MTTEIPRLLTIEDLRFDPPEFSIQEIRQLALDCYGIEGEFMPLDGERDQNHRVQAADGKRYVLKVSGLREPEEVVQMQVQALRHIEAVDPGLPVPRMQRALNGEWIDWYETDDGRHAVRLLSWLPGLRYQDGPFPTAAGLQDLGSFIARLGLALENFDHPAARHFMPWSISNGLVFSPQMRALLPAGLDRELAGYLDRLEQVIFPRLMQQRSQVIHQDAHAANILRSSREQEDVTGVIDFGDMIYGPLICDLAACASDFMEMGSDPVRVAQEIAEGFHRVRPLLEGELDLLLDMVLVRHIMVLQLFEFRRINMEQPPAFVIDDLPAVITSLRELMQLDRDEFAKTLKRTLKRNLKESVKNA